MIIRYNPALKKLAIELDGYTHHFTEVMDKDKEKTKTLNKLGITVIRFTDSQVLNDIQNVLTEIQEHLNK